MNRIKYIEEAYKKHYRLFANVSYRICYDIPEAHDCVGKAVLICLEANFPIKNIDHAKELILMISKRNAIKYRLKLSNVFKHRHHMLMSAEEYSIDEIDYSYWPLDKRIYYKLSMFKEETQAIFKTWLMGLDFVTIGQLYGKSDTTISSLVYDTLDRIRERCLIKKLSTKVSLTDKIFELLETGLSALQISQKLCYNYNTIYACIERRKRTKKYLEALNKIQ